MKIFDTEKTAGFELRQDGDVVSLSNSSGHIEIDREQLLSLLALTRNWAETGEPILWPCRYN